MSITNPGADAPIGRLVDALGGASALSATAIEKTVATGWRRHPGWGTDPSEAEHVADFTSTLELDLAAPRYRLSCQTRTYLVPADLDFTEVGDGSRGHVTGVDFMFDPRPVDVDVPSWRVAARLRHFDLTSPLRLARRLTAAGADVTAEPGPPAGSRETTILTLREFGRPPVRLQTDAVTGRPIAAEVTEEHSPRGDALVRVVFDDFRLAGPLLAPFRVDITIDGLHVHSETRSAVSVHESAGEAAFAVPGESQSDATLEQAAYALYSTEWIMNYVYAGVRFYFDLQTEPVTPKPIDLAPGVKLIIGPSHNTMIVELPDRLLAVEAPLYDGYSRAALAQVKAAFPGKPFRDLVGTHFHYDHIGGIREFAADGDLTIHVGQATVPFFEEILRSPHTVDPDRLTATSAIATVQGIEDSLVLPAADGGTVEIYRIRSDHSVDMLIVYVSSGKLVFNSDLWNPTPQMPERNAQRGRLATQLYDAIRERGLDAETMVGCHQGSDGTTWAHAAPIEYLKRAAGY